MKFFSKKRPTWLLFDVNETLLDMSAMQAAVNTTFENELAFKFWFAQLIQYAQVENVTDRYYDFSKVGQAAMQMTAEMMGKEVPEAKQKELVEMVKNTPPHPDAIPGLKKLKEAGFLMATLSNSPAKSSFPHLESVGLMDFFDKTFSVDKVEKFKPHHSTYYYAAEQLNVDIGEIMLVAAHGWDVAGALRAGARAAFLSRPGQALYPLAPEPEITASTVIELADQLILME